MNRPSQSPRNGEQGIALVVVMLLGLIAIALGTALVSYGSTSTPLSRQSQDWNGAMSAAEAGLDDYIHKLTVDGNYWTHGANPPEPNAALTGFKDIPGVAKSGEFTYSILGTPSPDRPTVRLEVTGKVRGEERTIQATLRRSSFLDFIYLTNFETKDPIVYDPALDGAGRDVNYANANCAGNFRFALGTRPARGNGRCTEIQFASFDRIRGPLYSNDSLLIAGGATFEQEVYTNWRPNPTLAELWVRTGTGNPNFQDGAPQNPTQEIQLPPSNDKLAKLADPGQGGAGCLYTGPTSIHLHDGKMDVFSPRTRSTNPLCGPGLNLDLPVNGVVFVQNVPPHATRFTNPNANVSATNPCTYWTAIVRTSANALACPMPNGAGVRYPPGFTVPVNGDRLNTSPTDRYLHTTGDVFLTGELDGKLTIGSDNDIVIMDDVKYKSRASSSDDLLGLIPENSVKVFHPVTAAGVNLTHPWDRDDDGDGNPDGATIHAAILAVKHSFSVQNYAFGAPLGRLNVFGAIAQQYRGIVGRTGATVRGFQKDYQYDERLRVQSPPHFLDPEKTAWQVKTWSEVGVNR